MSSPSVKTFSSNGAPDQATPPAPDAKGAAPRGPVRLAASDTASRPGVSKGKAARGAGLQKTLLGVMTTVAAVSLIANVVIYERFTTLRPLVTVGNHTITKREYYAVLEDTAGKQVLQKMVFAELIRQAATKAGVMPTDKDVDARLAGLQARDPKGFAVVPEYKMRDAAVSDLTLENLRIKDVKVTDAEVKQFYAAHQSLFRQQGMLNAAMIVTSNGTDAQTAAHLFEQNVAPNVISKQPGFNLVGANGFTIDMQKPSRLPIVKSIFAMKDGSVQTFRLDSQYLTVKVYKSVAAHPLSLAQVRDQVVRLTKLEKAPSASAELASLYKTSQPSFEIGKYEQNFQDIDQPNAAKD